MIEIILSSDALDDLNEGAGFYEAQDPGLGEYFIACLRSDIEKLKVTAGIHRKAFRNRHRLRSRVFPYVIYYTLSDETVTIWSIVDGRRHPEWIRRRLGG